MRSSNPVARPAIPTPRRDNPVLNPRTPDPRPSTPINRNRPSVITPSTPGNTPGDRTPKRPRLDRPVAPTTPGLPVRPNRPGGSVVHTPPPVTPGFDRPILSRPPIHRGGGSLTGGAFVPVDTHTRVVVNLGVGVNVGSYDCPPPPPILRHCFTYYDHFRWRHHFSHRRWFRPIACFDPWWHGRRWCHFYYYRWDPWCPSWHWRPVYFSYSYPCGTFFRVRYHRYHCDWLPSFSFAFCTAPIFTRCALISPSVYAYDGWTWSTNGAFRYGWFSSAALLGPADTTSAVIYASGDLPAPATMEDLRGNSDRELADVYMRLGDLDNAIRVYSDHIASFPGDVLAQRSLGVALIADDRPEEGAARVELAYRIDPTLAERPYRTDVLAGDSIRQHVLDNATRHASEASTPAAWLTVAVLMQAFSEHEPARAALDKAAEAGLAENVVEWMRAVLPVPNQN